MARMGRGASGAARARRRSRPPRPRVWPRPCGNSGKQVGREWAGGREAMRAGSLEGARGEEEPESGAHAGRWEENGGSAGSLRGPRTRTRSPPGPGLHPKVLLVRTRRRSAGRAFRGSFLGIAWTDPHLPLAISARVSAAETAPTAAAAVSPNRISFFPHFCGVQACRAGRFCGLAWPSPGSG